MELIKGLFVLFVLLELLVYLVPGESYRKYLHFFAEVIMTFAFLSPILSLFWDSENFLEQVHYESFVEGLNELSRDTAKIEFAQNDYYIKKYELAIAEDVRQIAEGEGYEAADVTVHLSEDYTMEKISLTVKKLQESDIFVAPVEVGEKSGEKDCEKLRSKLANYYQMKEEAIVICGG